jgi:hypothetical protein
MTGQRNSERRPEYNKSARIETNGGFGMNASLKRMLILILVLTVAGAGTALANSVYEYVKARKAPVTFNGKKLAADGYFLQVNKKTVPVLDAESLLAALDGYVRYDEKTGQINVFKPNVQLTVNVKLNKKDQTHTHSHLLKNNWVHDIRVTVFADNVTEEIEAMQLTITDPAGKEILRSIDDSDIPKSLASNTFTQLNMDFPLRIEKPGLYTVEFSVRPKGDTRFYRVGKTVFESVE